MRSLNTILFAGPSAYGVGVQRFADVELRPPAQRDDIARLIAERQTPGTILLCDGIFQSVAAVSHAELCRALDASWQVWGVSSLGAIRAWELRYEGMRGFGYVYEQFSRFDDFTDDELCLLHFPEEPYFPVSEALVNVRYALEVHRKVLGIKVEAEAAVLSTLRGLWFGDRTRQKLEEVLLDQGRLGKNIVRELLEWTDKNRIKSLDLARLLNERPWLA